MVIVAALAMLLAAPVAITGPSTAAGDGKTPQTIRVRIPAPAVQADDLELATDAGTLTEPVAAADGSFEVQWTPPLVAERIEARLTAAVAGRKGSAATLRVGVTALGADLVARSSKGSLDLTAPVAMLLAGEGAAKEVPISWKAGTSAVTLVASAGSIVRGSPAAAGGRETAVFRPPAAKFPQIAIIAAIDATGAVVDWTAIRLLGQPKVETVAKPESMVRVRVGDVEFGPVRAAKGRADVAVRVPPGVTRATAIAVDRFGATKETSIDLAVPPFSRLLAHCREGGVTAIAVDATGNPDPSAVLELVPTGAGLAPPTVIAPGIWESTLTGTDGLTVDAIAIRASLRGDAASQVSCRAPLGGQAPSALRVTLDRTSFVAGSQAGGKGGRIAVTVEPVYEGNRRRAPVAVKLAASHGTVVAKLPPLTSAATVTWQVPDAFAQAASASIVATTGSLRAEKTLALVSAPVASISALPDRTKLKADGKGKVGVAIALVDSFGNAASSSGIDAKADAGSVVLLSSSNGTARAEYTAPSLYRAKQERLVFREAASGRESVVSLRLVAQERRFGGTLRAGYLTNLGRVSAPLVLAGAAWRAPWTGERLSLGIEAGWYSASSKADTGITGAGAVDVAVTATPVLARATFDLVRSPVGLYAGATGGAVLAQVETSSPETGTRTTGKPRPAVGAILGADLPLGRGRIGLETGWWQVTIDEETVTGNLGGLSLTAGYRLSF